MRCAVFGSPLLDSQRWMNDATRLLLDLPISKNATIIEMVKLKISHDFYVKEKRTEKEEEYLIKYGPA